MDKRMDDKLEKWFPLQGERAHVLLLPSQSSYPAYPSSHFAFLSFSPFFSGSPNCEFGKTVDFTPKMGKNSKVSLRFTKFYYGDIHEYILIHQPVRKILSSKTTLFMLSGSFIFSFSYSYHKQEVRRKVS